MITLGVSVSTRVESTAPYVEVSCRVDDKRGSKRRRPLLDCANARFKNAVPVRPFRWSWGGRHFPGWYCAATTGQHVGFESWLEVTGPELWTRQTCASWVAAVDRMTVGDYSQWTTGMRSQGRIGKPLTP